MKFKDIHIVIVSFQRLALLKTCLQSVFNSAKDLPDHIQLHLHLLVNGPDIESIQWIKKLTHKTQNVNIHLTENSMTLPPGQARNQLLCKIDSGWTFFLDDDAHLPQEYFTNFLAIANNNSWANIIGGPNLTPPKASLFVQACNEVLQSPFGAGPFRNRYTQGRSGETKGDHKLILCNLWVQSGYLRLFKKQISAGEENILIRDLFRDGARALYNGSLFVFHERRSNWIEFSKQCMRYGIGRAQVILSHDVFKRWPSLSVFLLLLCLLILFILPVYLLFLLFVFLLASIKTRRLKKSLLISFCTGTLHIFYILGLLTGLARLKM